MQNVPKPAKEPVTLMLIHHQSGALFSTIPEIRSEIHAIEWLFRTSGRLGIRSAKGIVAGPVSDTKHYPSDSFTFDLRLDHSCSTMTVTDSNLANGKTTDWTTRSKQVNGCEAMARLWSSCGTLIVYLLSLIISLYDLVANIIRQIRHHISLYFRFSPAVTYVIRLLRDRAGPWSIATRGRETTSEAARTVVRLMRKREFCKNKHLHVHRSTIY
jgi:hypothetical protein